MKKLLPVILSLLLLSSCADTGESEFLKFTESVSSAENISFTADVRAQYSDSTAEFTLAYEKSGDEATVQVVKPELISGIKANVKGNDISLEYDGAMLDIGTLPDAELSPMSSLPLIVGAIRSGQLEISWTEDELIAARLVPADDYVVTLWINSALEPVTAEISYKEKTTVFVDISDWTIG